jgi:hypothetical protein
MSNVYFSSSVLLFGRLSLSTSLLLGFSMRSSQRFTSCNGLRFSRFLQRSFAYSIHHYVSITFIFLSPKFSCVASFANTLKKILWCLSLFQAFFQLFPDMCKCRFVTASVEWMISPTKICLFHATIFFF